MGVFSVAMFDDTGGYVKDADYYTSPTQRIRAPIEGPGLTNTIDQYIVRI